MRAVVIIFLTLLGCLMIGSAAIADQGIIYGKIYTVDDEILEGFIRWDQNEASWDDILDGNKDLDNRRGKKDRDRDRRRDSRKITIFGATIYSEGNGIIWDSDEALSGVRFGHIKELTPVGDDAVELVLKSGQEIELTDGSGDIGSDNRGIWIDDNKEGDIELYWDDIDKIEFLSGPDREPVFGKRLYGTLTTRRGEEFTGFVCWDMDETYTEDILDGDEEHRSRKIAFENIARIERRSSGSAEITLKSGKSMRISGSNDIDNGNRGIVISDPNMGSIIVQWDDFDALEFKNPPKGPAYTDFDGGKKLKGTVYTESGDKFTGEIRWDDDEEYTWEILDGNTGDIELNIEFGKIKMIEKRSERGSIVTLLNGQNFRLRDSNDIDDDNRGIFIITDKGEEFVEWDEFEKVEFSQ